MGNNNRGLTVKYDMSWCVPGWYSILIVWVSFEDTTFLFRDTDTIVVEVKAHQREYWYGHAASGSHHLDIFIWVRVDDFFQAKTRVEWLGWTVIAKT